MDDSQTKWMNKFFVHSAIWFFKQDSATDAFLHNSHKSSKKDDTRYHRVSVRLSVHPSVLSPVHTSNDVEATGNIVEATFDFVEATFDFVATNGNNVERVS